jgi:hypothetical protein
MSITDQEVAEIAIVRAERDAYRLLAVNEGWNWRMVDAYGHDDYLRHRINEIDAKAQRTIESGYDAAGYLRDGLAGAAK